MKLSKKLVTGLLAATFVMGAGAITASAWDHSADAIYVELKSNMTNAYSDTRTGKYTYLEGNNSSDKEQLWFEVQYSEGPKWVEDVKFLVSPSTSLFKQQSHPKNKDVIWRVELNPYGIVWGATGYGWIW